MSPGTAPGAADVPGESAQPRVPEWEEVARDYGRFLYTIAYRLTANRADAEDLVQETLLRVRRGLRTYRPGSMEGWLTRIATNAFIDSTRRRRRVETPLSDSTERQLPTSAAADDVLAGETLSSEVQAALMALPVEFRVPVVLCDVAGRSYEEIAGALDIPLGTVRSRIHRGRSQLRHALGGAR